MTDPEFMDRAERVLSAIESSCDRINAQTDADIDNQRVGGMVTLAFPTGSEIVVNLQKPLQEIWLASRSGGYHFRFDDRQWLDTKGQGEFFALLSREAGAQSGQSLAFTPSPVVPE
jgi:CyaY protein